MGKCLGEDGLAPYCMFFVEISEIIFQNRVFLCLLNVCHL